MLIAGAAGLASFAGAFVTGWVTRPAALGAAEPAAAPAADASVPVGTPLLPSPAPVARDAPETHTLTEQQLKELINEVRAKIQEYDRQLGELEKEKERLQVARQLLKKDIDKLTNLRVDLAATVAGMKSERDALLKARIEVDHVERTNLTAIAAAYDKMDAAMAGEILKSMAEGQTANGATAPAAGADDAVKILHFMQERTKAKVLAELAATEPALAASLSLRLKQIVEKK